MYFDPRIFKIVFKYGSTELSFDGDLDIKATGMKYANALQNECSLEISNLKRDTREQLLTQLTPYNYDQERKSVEVYAGRESTGLFLLYKGDIVNCYPSQPPDIVLNIRSMALQWYKYNYIAQSYNISTPLSEIADGIGQSLGLPVDFRATDKNIANYAYSGSKTGEIAHFNSLGVQMYEDNGNLIVKNKGDSLPVSHIINQESGMIGAPELTEYGVKVKMLLSPSVVLGGKINLESKLFPLANGELTIYQLGFDIASRDTNFYGLIFASKYPIIYNYASLPE